MENGSYHTSIFFKFSSFFFTNIKFPASANFQFVVLEGIKSAVKELKQALGPDYRSARIDLKIEDFDFLRSLHFPSERCFLLAKRDAQVSDYRVLTELTGGFYFYFSEYFKTSHGKSDDQFDD